MVLTFLSKVFAESFIDSVKDWCDCFGYVTVDEVCEKFRQFGGHEIHCKSLGSSIKVDDTVGWTSFDCSFVKGVPDDIYVLYVDNPTRLTNHKPAPESTEGATNDPVNHPAHYQGKNGMETLAVIEAFTDGLNGIEANDTGNVIKYVCRWKKKNGIEDLKKARYYVNHLIDHLEKESK